MKPIISLVVPLYNEEESIGFLVERLNNLMNSLSLEIEVVLVNDGSQDKTEELIYAIGMNDKRYQIISLSRNFGHQFAITAGLKYTNANEAVMILDGDLQDPPELLETFYKYYEQGYDVVYGVRKKRKESFIQRISYHTFYRILRSLSLVDIPLDSGDFSLLSRRVVDLINSMPEESRYIRGMRAWAGFKQIGVEYERDTRVAGQSKYSFKELFKLAYNGIFNFSVLPIKFITSLGIGSISIALLYFLKVLYQKIFSDDVPIGFTGLLFAIILFGGVQLVCLGVIGEYVSRTFFQVKQRPLFIVKNRLFNGELIEEGK